MSAEKNTFAIETTSLTKKYGNKVVVKRLNLKVREGEIYGFIGRNGAGKSTTLKMLCGIASPTEGEIRIFEKPVSDPVVRRRLGVLIESAGLYFHMTARQNVMMKAKCMGITDEKSVEEVLRMTGLADAGKKKVKHFSMGMKQRLALRLRCLEIRTCLS